MNPTLEVGQRVKVTPPETMGPPYEGTILYLNEANERVEVQVTGSYQRLLAHPDWVEVLP
jgi:hypothetical protein